MPAIDLTRLRIQLAELVDQAGRPEAFIRRLDSLLEFYDDRTYRPGQSGTRRSLLPFARVPAPLLRELERATAPIARDPALAFPLLDALWARRTLESQRLAVFLLRQVPVQEADALQGTLERVQAWARPETDFQVLQGLLASGDSTLQRAYPERWLALLGAWLTEADPAVQRLGVFGLHSLAQDAGFQNLPAIYGLLMPLMHRIPTALQPDLTEVVETLAGRSPVETTAFLRQALALGRESGVSRLVRRSLAAFPEQQQASLRAALVATLQPRAPK